EQVRTMQEEQTMRYITTFERTAIEQGVRQGLEQGLERGLIQGEATILRRLLARRFGPLPEWAEGRVQRASSEQLQAWADAVLDAETLDGVFASSSS
ncbi:MAG: DUF4351 domain-containing protein, partial [Lamprobacter sp.]|uniref:DUF4351 domain-containing protein n=1 Tax=Lamprobacter sp. TaxID=3100796 RepID=UPI002B26153C